MGLSNLKDEQRSGSYVPTLVPGSNMDAVTPIAAFFQVVGNVVTVFLQVTTDQTAVGVSDFTVSLPPGLSRFFGGTDEAAGCVSFGSVGVGRIESTLDEATVTVIGDVGADTPDTTAGSFAYELLG